MKIKELPAKVTTLFVSSELTSFNVTQLRLLSVVLFPNFIYPRKVKIFFDSQILNMRTDLTYKLTFSLKNPERFLTKHYINIYTFEGPMHIIRSKLNSFGCIDLEPYYFFSLSPYHLAICLKYTSVLHYPKPGKCALIAHVEVHSMSTNSQHSRPAYFVQCCLKSET